MWNQSFWRCPLPFEVLWGLCFFFLWLCVVSPRVQRAHRSGARGYSIRIHGSTSWQPLMSWLQDWAISKQVRRRESLTDALWESARISQNEDPEPRTSRAATGSKDVFASHEEKNISVKGGEIKDSASTILASVMVKRVLLRSPGQRRTQPLYEQTVEDVYGERRITMSSLSSRLTWDLPTKHPCKVERGDWSADHHGQGHDGSNGTVDGCDWWGDVWCHRSKTSIDTHSLELSLNCTLVDNKAVIKIIYNDEVQRWDTSQ